MDHEHDVFISYSHAADTDLAAAVHKALHRLNKPWHRWRALDVFRDTANLAANPDLWGQLTERLERSRYLLLLASPDAAASDGVAHEVGFWTAHRSPDTLLIARTGGHIEFRDQEIDWSATDALPACLRSWLTTEPLVPDLTRDRFERADLKDPGFRAELLKIVAPLHGLTPAELDGTDRRRHRRTVRTVVTALSAFLVLAVAAASVSVWQRNEAVAQRQIAEDQRQLATARLLASEAENKRDSDPATSLAASLAALELDSTADIRSGLAETLMTTRLNGTAARVGDPRIGDLEVAFGPDGRTAVTSAATGEVDNSPKYHYETTVWDTANPTRWTRLAALPAVDRMAGAPAVAFSPDGTMLAVAGESVELWDLTDRSAPARLGGLTAEAVESLAFGRDGRVLAIATAGRVALWRIGDAGEALLITELPGVREAHHVGFAPDGRTLATTRFAVSEAGPGEHDHQTTLWDLRDPGRPVPTAPILGHRTGTVFGVAFSADGRLLATAGADGSVLLWDVANRAAPKRLAVLRGHLGQVHAVAFEPRGTRLVSGGDDGAIIWDIADRTRPRRTATLTGHARSVTTVAFGQGGVFTAGRDGAVNQWRVAGRRRPAATATLSGHQGAVADVALSEDGDLVATASTDQTVRLTDVSGRHGPTVLREDSPVVAVAFGPHRRLVIGGQDGVIQLWDVSGTPRRVGSLDLDDYELTDLAISPDGHTLLTTGSLLGGRVELWDIADPAAPVRLAALGTTTTGADGADSVAFAPDGRTVAVGNSTLELWDIADRRAPRRLVGWDGARYADALAFGSHGRMLVVAGALEPADTVDDEAVGGLMLVDLADPTHPRRRGTARAGSVDDVALAPDGHTALTGGDQPALWDVGDPDHPALLTALAGHASSATTVAFGEDGHTLVSGSADSTAIVWDAGDLPGVVTRWHELACTTAGDGFSDAEWDRLAPGVRQPHPCS